MAGLLLEKGADAKATDGNGMTALHYLLMSTDADAVAEDWTARLLKAGASAMARACSGLTPLEMAEERRREGVVKLLRAEREEGTSP